MRSEFNIPTKLDELKYTILLQTFGRHHNLESTLHFFRAFCIVSKILIINNNIDKLIPESALQQGQDNSVDSGTTAPIIFIQSSTNQLNNRFLPRQLINTQAVFHIDEDLSASEKNMEEEFSLWKTYSNLIVKRKKRLAKERLKDSHKFVYALPSTGYNIVLTSRVFIHMRYHEAYHCLPPLLLRFIDDQVNYEDIAMNFVVSSLCNCTGSLSTTATWRQRRLRSLNKRPDHYEGRTVCLNAFAKNFA